MSDDDVGRGESTGALSEPLTASREKEVVVDRIGGGLLIWLGVSGIAMSAGGSKEFWEGLSSISLLEIFDMMEEYAELIRECAQLAAASLLP